MAESGRAAVFRPKLGRISTLRALRSGWPQFPNAARSQGQSPRAGHTLATRLVEDKVPLNIVQGILGHSSIETTRKYLHKNEDIEREAIGMMSDYLNMGQMDAAPRLNGTAPRAKFADVVLPTFPQRRNHTA